MKEKSFPIIMGARCKLKDRRINMGKFKLPKSLAKTEGTDFHYVLHFKRLMPLKVKGDSKFHNRKILKTKVILSEEAMYVLVQMFGKICWKTKKEKK